MWEKFYPDHFYDTIFEIPYKTLKEKNIQALIFDVDNTLTAYRAKRPPEKTSSLLLRLKKMGFKIALLTNNNKQRLTVFNENLKLPAYHQGLKPLAGKAKKAMKELGVSAGQTAIIGDQALTDIWCGKRLKLTTILVKPISQKDAFGVVLKRGLEKKIISSYLKNHDSNLKNHDSNLKNHDSNHQEPKK
ncbi:MAG: YqeG family HAD IIIA-type phosphatase [Clostridiales bacterium]|jgi:HAD superfamily phosphatase (TIGR01668 family)|nr:YqeG family HAD IIIA-type phosphatase [Clostridiales bacterium]